MKKLLLTSALTVAGLGFANGAMAQTISNDTITTATELSLLERILADAAQLQNSMLNAAENYANLDGSITVGVDMPTLLTGIALGGDGTEGSGVNATGFVQSISYTDAAIAVDFFDPSTVSSSMADLSTTVIGALGTGTIGQTTDSSGTDADGNVTSSSTLSGVNLALLDVASNAQAITSTSQAYSTTMVEAPGLVQLANIAGNYSQDLNGAINLTFADSLLAGGDMATTVIGALGTGSISASLQRNLIGTSGIAGTN
jgi:hypothetical protein